MRFGNHRPFYGGEDVKVNVSTIDTPGPKGVRILELITALSGFPYLGLTRLGLNRTY